MDLKQLETFITVVEWDSFSEAARRLYLTQPTISTHIKQLEEELNTKLISRTTKKLELTKDGREFYNYAKSISFIMQNIQDQFSNRALTNFNIGASSVPATYILPDLISKFRKGNYDTKINIIQSDSSDVISKVLSGAMNVGFVGMTTNDKNLSFHRIMSDKLVITTPCNDYFKSLKKSKVKLETLFQEPLIFREQGSGTLKESMKMIEALDISKSDINIAATTNNPETVKACIKSGLGISIMSKLSVKKEVDDGELLIFPIDEFESIRHFYIVHRNDLTHGYPVNEFIDFSKEYFKEMEEK
ncbi:MAG: selenium metabolism-associated LysR family transcriptional regulator [Finegoldia sp.]|nr:selenium metabolism-associated LysR family transcriptional regulator [Finegoldia sp.]